MHTLTNKKCEAKLTWGKLPAVNPSGAIVRVIKRKAKRHAFSRPSRYSICVSTTPKNRFASEWTDAGGDLASAGGAGDGTRDPSRTATGPESPRLSSPDITRFIHDPNDLQSISNNYVVSVLFQLF